jgi:hypothetical protein
MFGRFITVCCGSFGIAREYIRSEREILECSSGFSPEPGQWVDDDEDIASMETIAKGLRDIDSKLFPSAKDEAATKLSETASQADSDGSALSNSQ